MPFGQLLEEGGQHRALVGADERLDGHAGHELEVVEALDFVSRHPDANEVIGLPVR